MTGNQQQKQQPPRLGEFGIRQRADEVDEPTADVPACSQPPRPIKSQSAEDGRDRRRTNGR